MSPDKESDINTLELAKLYEAQGYHEDALKVYSSLDAQESSEQTRAGIQRNQTPQPKVSLTRDDPAQQAGQDSKKEKIATLFGEWLKLLVLKQRLERYKKIKARLS